MTAKRIGEVSNRIVWWRREAADLRRDRLSRLQLVGRYMDELLDVIQAQAELLERAQRDLRPTVNATFDGDQGQELVRLYEDIDEALKP